ncbi:MAG: hypothetical protein JW866_05515 [Ignavibacteriales bacterium]|nr:hypothetical protein [Ignavibacteriales bacterium]
MKNSICFILLIFFVPRDLDFNNFFNSNSDYEEILLFCSSTNPYISSSEYQNEDIREFGPYGPHNLFDKNPATCWTEGTSSGGINEYVICGLPENSQKLHFRNGNCKNSTDFNKFNRCKEISVQIYIAAHILGNEIEVFCVYEAVKYDTKVFSVKDTKDVQAFNLDINWDRISQTKNSILSSYIKRYKLANPNEAIAQYIVKIQIADIFFGTKVIGTSISDIWFSD